MKKIIKSVLIFSILLLVPISVVDAYQYVNGYTKANGTYVAPYVRSNPNGLKYDNYSWTPSQGLYNDSYGTRGSSWDTPTWYTDPDYYQGKSLYENNSYSSSGYTSSYTPSYSGLLNNSYGSGSAVSSSVYCGSGYYKKSGSCIKAPANSSAYGFSSFYCNYGYYEDGDYCRKDPDNGYSIGSTIYCDYGYEKSGSYCVKKRKEASYYNTSYNTSYTPSYDSSYSNTKSFNSVKDCRAEYGEFARYNNMTSKCSCSDESTFDSATGKCISLRKYCRNEYGRDYKYDEDTDACVIPSTN